MDDPPEVDLAADTQRRELLHAGMAMRNTYDLISCVFFDMFTKEVAVSFGRLAVKLLAGSERLGTELRLTPQAGYVPALVSDVKRLAKMCGSWKPEQNGGLTTSEVRAVLRSIANQIDSLFPVMREIVARLAPPPPRPPTPEATTSQAVEAESDSDDSEDEGPSNRRKGGRANGRSGQQGTSSQQAKKNTKKKNKKRKKKGAAWDTIPDYPESASAIIALLKELKDPQTYDADSRRTFGAFVTGYAQLLYEIELAADQILSTLRVNELHRAQTLRTTMLLKKQTQAHRFLHTLSFEAGILILLKQGQARKALEDLPHLAWYYRSVFGVDVESLVIMARGQDDKAIRLHLIQTKNAIIKQILAFDPPPPGKKVLGKEVVKEDLDLLFYSFLSRNEGPLAQEIQSAVQHRSAAAWNGSDAAGKKLLGSHALDYRKRLEGVVKGAGMQERYEAQAQLGWVLTSFDEQAEAVKAAEAAQSVCDQAIKLYTTSRDTARAAPAKAQATSALEFWKTQSGTVRSALKTYKERLAEKLKEEAKAPKKKTNGTAKPAAGAARPSAGGARSSGPSATFPNAAGGQGFEEMMEQMLRSGFPGLHEDVSEEEETDEDDDDDSDGSDGMPPLEPMTDASEDSMPGLEEAWSDQDDDMPPLERVASNDSDMPPLEAVSSDDDDEYTDDDDSDYETDSD